MLIVLAILPRFSLFFFFNDTATTEIYTLSLHDALPISVDGLALERLLVGEQLVQQATDGEQVGRRCDRAVRDLLRRHVRRRSEEHTSELQSPCNLVCRLLLEKKKNKLAFDARHTKGCYSIN